MAFTREKARQSRRTITTNSSQLVSLRVSRASDRGPSSMRLSPLSIDTSSTRQVPLDSGPRRRQAEARKMLDLDFAAQMNYSASWEHGGELARVVPRVALAFVVAHEDGWLATEAMAQELEQRFDWLADGTRTSRDAQTQIETTIREAVMPVTRSASDPTRVQEMALVAAAFVQREIVVVQSGHGRCYRLRQGNMELLAATSERAFAGSLELGAAGERASAGTNEPELAQRHLLLQSTVSHFEEGDVYLLCSDSLQGAAGSTTMVRVLKSSQEAKEACEQLCAIALHAGSPSALGAAVVRVTRPALGLGLPPTSFDELPSMPALPLVPSLPVD